LDSRQARYSVAFAPHKTRRADFSTIPAYNLVFYISLNYFRFSLYLFNGWTLVRLAIPSLLLLTRRADFSTIPAYNLVFFIYHLLTFVFRSIPSTVGRSSGSLFRRFRSSQDTPRRPLYHPCVNDINVLFPFAFSPFYYIVLFSVCQCFLSPTTIFCRNHFPQKKRPKPSLPKKRLGFFLYYSFGSFCLSVSKSKCRA